MSAVLFFSFLIYCFLLLHGVCLPTNLPHVTHSSLHSEDYNIAKEYTSDRITRGLAEQFERSEPPEVTARQLKKDGAVMVPGTRAIYTLSNGVKHLIPDWDTFCSLGYDLSSVLYISAEKMASYPTGPDVPAVTESAPRDYRQPCPCASRSRNPYAISANATIRARNICILKNKAMDKLFIEVYELNMLQKHLHFLLINEEQMANEEAFRWRLYNETVRTYASGNYTNKYTSYPTIGSFIADDQERNAIHTSQHDAQKVADATANEANKQNESKQKAEVSDKEKQWAYDSDSDPYPSPYFSNGNTGVAAPRFTRRTRADSNTHLRKRRQLKFVDERRRLTAAKASDPAKRQATCDVVIEIMPEQFDFAAHACPGICQPHPRALVPVDLLMPSPKSPDMDLTCSLTLTDVFGVDPSAGTGDTQTSRHRHAVEEPNTKDAAHARLAMILHAVARRKLEECQEKDFWIPAPRNRLRDDTVSTQSNYLADPPKAKVRGLLVWVSSLSRFSLARAQIEILKSQSVVSRKDRIVGWLATEEVYPCTIGSTTCTTLSPSLAYYNYMPTSKLNILPAGYNCAQRRTMRSIAHVLHLFEPEFLFVVDDDTWVNIAKLHLGGPLDTFIKESMHDKVSPKVLGQLTHGKKITKKGFFYGGSGYLMGRGAIDRLLESRISGPPDNGDAARDPVQTSRLQIMMQALEASRESCKSCIAEDDRTSKLSWEKFGPDVYVDLTGGARLVDACMNLMSEEHTCYASDHAMSRCLVHGVYATVLDINCEAGTTLHSSAGDAHFGMCMGVEKCDPAIQLTCHRWMADPADYGRAIPNAWSETDD